jgi:peptide/nickel transport system substrate-binding protein
VTDELSASDDRTIQFKMKRPFPMLLAALGKVSAPTATS